MLLREGQENDSPVTRARQGSKERLCYALVKLEHALHAPLAPQCGASGANRAYVETLRKLEQA